MKSTRRTNQPVARMELDGSWFREDDGGPGSVFGGKLPLELRVGTLAAVAAGALRAVEAEWPEKFQNFFYPNAENDKKVP